MLAVVVENQQVRGVNRARAVYTSYTGLPTTRGLFVGSVLRGRLTLALFLLNTTRDCCEERRCQDWMRCSHMQTTCSDALLKRGPLLITGIGYIIIALCSLVPGQYRPHIDGLSGNEEHTLAYLALGILTVIAARKTVSTYKLYAIIVAYAGILEFLQLFASGRQATVGNFIASALGGILGIALATFALKICHGLEAPAIFRSTSVDRTKAQN
jgi:VanZ family protein